MSMVELLVSTVVMLGILLGSLTFLISSTQVNETTKCLARLSQETHRAVDRVAEELISSNVDQLQGSVTALGSSSVSYRLPTGFDTGIISWGTLRRIEMRDDPDDPADDIDNNDNGLIDEQQVVLRVNAGAADEVLVVLCDNVTELLEGEIENADDDNGNELDDEPGFVLSLDGRNLTIRLTRQSVAPNREVITRTVETSITFRN